MFQSTSRFKAGSRLALVTMNTDGCHIQPPQCGSLFTPHRAVLIHFFLSFMFAITVEGGPRSKLMFLELIHGLFIT